MSFVKEYRLTHDLEGAPEHVLREQETLEMVRSMTSFEIVRLIHVLEDELQQELPDEIPF